MSTQQPIQFLLHQLATNEGNLERFNQVSEVKAYISITNNKLCFQDEFVDDFFYLWNLSKKEIIRTCLSRIDIDGDSVLDVFKSYHVQLNCYLAFDYVLRNGNPLDTAIQALHEKMLELVPEYREFVTTK